MVPQKVVKLAHARQDLVNLKRHDGVVVHLLNPLLGIVAFFEALYSAKSVRVFAKPSFHA
jgi:hypothetical protein